LPAALELAHVQRWMQAVITHPDGVAEGVSVERLEDIVRGSSRLPARERLELYSRDYHLRLLDCLRSSHPALRELLGEELFDAFALDYLRACPPHGYTLGRLGAGFAEHLDRTRPADAEWATLIVELARVERAFAEVYDGPGVEGERILGPDALPRESDPWWLQARLEPVPCLRLLHSRFPVGAYLSAVRAGEQPATPRARESFIALCRTNWVVTVTELGARGHGARKHDAREYDAREHDAREHDAREYDARDHGAREHDALAHLMAGRALGDLGEPRAWEWLRGWAAAGFLRGLAR
jgi:hypothetical protein